MSIFAPSAVARTTAKPLEPGVPPATRQIEGGREFDLRLKESERAAAPRASRERDARETTPRETELQARQRSAERRSERRPDRADEARAAKRAPADEKSVARETPANAEASPAEDDSRAPSEPVTSAQGPEKAVSGGGKAELPVEPAPSSGPVPPTPVAAAPLPGVQPDLAIAPAEPVDAQESLALATAETPARPEEASIPIAAVSTPAAAVIAAAPLQGGEADPARDAAPAAASGAKPLASASQAQSLQAAPQGEPRSNAEAGSPAALPNTASQAVGEQREALKPVDTLKAVAVMGVASDPAPASPSPGTSVTPAAQTAATAEAVRVADPAAAAARGDQPVPLQAVAVEIGMRALRGAKEFAIRLDPEDLGRVDVNLAIDDKGEVKATLVVERVETLQLLQRDARTLERAFDQAGLKTNPDGLQFTLRDPGQQGRGRGDDGRPQAHGKAARDGDAPEITLQPIHYRRVSASGLDIRI
jgi:flagellar hook-length control protein FliK